MTQFRGNLAILLELLRTRRGREWLRRTARRRIHSQTVSIGVRRDMNVPFPVPPAKIPLEVRKLRPDDDLSLVADTPDLTPEVARHRADQRWLLNSDLPPPWVAIDPDGAVCYIGYVFTAQDNPRMQALWGPLAPVLQPDEALLEGVFTSERHRALGVLLDAATQSMDKTREEFGVRYAIGIAGEKNIGSLKAAQKGEWIPRFKRIDRWFLFRHRVTFVPLDQQP